MSIRKVNRRKFLRGTAAAVAGTMVYGGRGARVSAMSKLNVAGIGIGGKGRSDINYCRSENIVALCDVDWVKGARTFGDFPNAARYKDFREMLEKEDIDAVTISTPDHTHAVIAAHAMRMGKHVYVQKPLTYTVAEARLLTEIARETGVATQMGNQGHSGDGVRQLCEMVWDGAIGQVREAHIWTNRPVWPQGLGRPSGSDPVPETLDWDLWLGPAPERPFVELHPDTGEACYHPWMWRGWQEFGCGALGDMACHIADPANWALQLHTMGPVSVEALRNEGMTDEMFPNKSVIKYEFPQRGAMDPVTVYWYDGGLMPPMPEGVPEGTLLGEGKNGSLLIGSDGILTADEYGDKARLLPDALMKDYEFPTEVIPRIAGKWDEAHHLNWIQACKGGVAACSNFGYAGPFTEWVVMGNLALHFNEKLEWNAKKMKVTNNRKANKYVTRKYRKEWDLGI